MNILFLTLIDFKTVQEHGIYQDLLREFSNHNHKVYIISPIEKRKQQDTHLIENENVVILKLKIGNIQKTNIVEKGISTVCIEPIFIGGIKKYFSDVKFDLVVYSTPPITFCKAVEYVKKRDSAKTYLLLKDIFPQNAVDMGMMRTTGVWGLLYKFFRQKEKKLYEISDYIGCMSQANVDYVINHNPHLDSTTIEVCPNSIEVIDKSVNKENRASIRGKYGIPLDKKIFVYGGNLGRPQGVDFLIQCIKSQKENKEVYFLIVGDGTEYAKLNVFFTEYPQENIKIMKRLSKEDYDTMVGACDVGMIFLDYRFTIPNFPSRLLSYMQAKLPVLVCTDPNTDIGSVVVKGGFGWRCASNDVKEFDESIRRVLNCDFKQMKKNAYQYLVEHYSSNKSYRIIMKHFE